MTNNAGGDINVAAESAVVFMLPVTGAGTISGSGTKYFADGSSSMTALATPGNSVVQAPATVTTGHVRESALDVSGRVIISPNGTNAGASFLGSLLITDSGELNLNDNDLVVQSGDFKHIQDWVLAGFGPSTGARITSGTSSGAEILALFDNALVGASEWAGQTIAIGAIVGKYTYFGDANLDGQVSGDDYTVVDANLGTDPAVGIEWLSGDANLDGIVTGDDYTVIDANLGLGSGSPLTTSALVTTAPEPGTMSWLMALSVAVVRQRKHYRSGG